jgi:hypothetical protein
MQKVTRGSRWRSGVILFLAGAMAVTSGCNDSDGGGGGGGRSMIVFNGEGCRLNAYDADTGARQTVIPSSNVPGGLDINAQICFFPDGSRRFIAGEDTGQPNPPQGWGIFQLEGSEVGGLSAQQIGKVVPTYQGSLSNAENYGCGFLSTGELVTGDVGDQASGPTNGQLILWFPPFDRPPAEQHYCKLDVGIGTAGGIWVDREDRIYIASARGPDAGILRFSPPYPTSDDAAGSCGRVDSTGAPLADNVTREVFIRDENVPTASGIVGTPRGTFYVSSVFNGVIAEYDANGALIDVILRPDPTPTGFPPYTTGTPFGIALASDGTIYYADIGIVVDLNSNPPRIGPGNRNGSVRRIRFENGEPVLPPEIVDTELAYPDGLGILE